MPSPPYSCGTSKPARPSSAGALSFSRTSGLSFCPSRLALDRDELAVDEAAHGLLEHAQLLRQLEIHVASSISLTSHLTARPNIDGAHALAFAEHDQRIDLEIGKRLAMLEEETRQARHRPRCGIDIARRAAAKCAEQRARLERSASCAPLPRPPAAGGSRRRRSTSTSTPPSPTSINGP